MKLQWFGHSCFLITSDRGRKILFDPYNDAVGYVVPEWEADIVLLSHKHFDHSNVAAVKSECTIIREAGNFCFKDFKIIGIDAYHDSQQGAVKGKNIIYVVEIDGIRICHCGDLGHIPDEAMLQQMKEIDYLLLPVGGNYTINGSQAAEAAEILSPRYVIPMHYKTDVCKIGIEPIDSYLEASGGKQIIREENVIDLDRMQETDVILMDYTR